MVPPPLSADDPQIYQISFPIKSELWDCPVEECRERVSIRSALRVHILHRNMRDTMVILEKVNLPHPR